MTLEDFLKDDDLAVATDLFNANAKSPGEMRVAYNKAIAQRNEFIDVKRKYKDLLYSIDAIKDDVNASEDYLRRLLEFKDSQEAKLIADYIHTKSEDSMAQIEAIINGENPFDIAIVPEWKRGDRERWYGAPYCAYFHIHYTDNFYTFDNWDIDEDISNCQEDIEAKKSELNAYMEKKNSMVAECGNALLMLDKEV